MLARPHLSIAVNVFAIISTATFPILEVCTHFPLRSRKLILVDRPGELELSVRRFLRSVVSSLICD